MTHLWVRAEQRANEARTGLTPEGAATLIAAGLRVTVEQSATRAIPLQGYVDAGCEIAPEGAWPSAPRDAIIFGLKELPEDGTPLPHRHIMFGHAFKGQHSGRALLKRFRAGGGTLIDLEYLTDAHDRRVAAFGYWAGYAGAAVTLIAWAAQQHGQICPPVAAYENKHALLADLAARLEATGKPRPSAIVIGALGRVGAGAADLCEALAITPTKWDMAETASGGPFPEILTHELFFNCIFARPGTPVFVPASAFTAPRKLTAIGDIACDPDSDYNPVPLYSAATTWAEPVFRAHETPPLDIMAIDNLPSLLPLEASEDFAAQLLPTLQALPSLATAQQAGALSRALAAFDAAVQATI
ncbi:saccharopine dehydrogenase [Aquicoccus sp. G2-2]|uniref:saccharopine dehydrogenase n=1 Tax=Aquicoccus sp. G2-2 TaxID=3092120 RepID=UPI002AE0AF96|nr:saccharopine dehydrogenase [Aquicoccus sp. G2-2]MEA1115134.1 saccharopine dehydrogenase [Aquicoccus sp. G2-2]